MVQDLPPSGGYDPIQYKRNVPARGFRPAYYLFAVGAVCTFGFYHITRENRQLNEFAREKAWARIHLVPLLEAESDRDAVRRQLAAAAHERDLMKDVKGWKFGSVYNTEKRRCYSQIYAAELHAIADRMNRAEGKRINTHSTSECSTTKDDTVSPDRAE
ncbi:hypothetical protein Q9L58_003236 [Maublancomyces gigas]|uniref:NADH dehydrogenase [ubiquinone] 1 alpha subcomplex subunit 13 n=1 Tax=Discina gigas TaxID=1032678 RepID=A0ABR3GPJ1_9PEZI